MNCVHRLPNWDDFVRVFCKEFGPSEFEDFVEALVKLKQTGSLRDYIFDFHRLANRTKDISPVLLKSYFIGGLRKEIRHDVKLLRPVDVHDATALAQQVDAKLSDLKVGSFHVSKNVSLPTPSLIPKPNNFKRLTPEEIQYKRQNNLCFHCDEKFVQVITMLRNNYFWLMFKMSWIMKTMTPKNFNKLKLLLVPYLVLQLLSPSKP